MAFTIRHLLEFVDPAPDPRIATVLDLLHSIYARQAHMASAIDKLTSQIEASTTVMQSATVLIGGLADQIRALKDDPAKLEKLANDLDAADDALAAAVASNTVAETEPEPTP